MAGTILLGCVTNAGGTHAGIPLHQSERQLPCDLLKLQAIAQKPRRRCQHRQHPFSLLLSLRPCLRCLSSRSRFSPSNDSILPAQQHPPPQWQRPVSRCRMPTFERTRFVDKGSRRDRRLVWMSRPSSSLRPCRASALPHVPRRAVGRATGCTPPRLRTMHQSQQHGYARHSC